MAAARPDRSTARVAGAPPDVSGVVVLGCCAAWALLSAAWRDGRPEGVLLAVLAVAAGFACGRISGGLLPVGAAAAAALAGLGLALASPGGVPEGSGFTKPGRYLTLTTCTPEVTSTNRMIV
ncbi:hypothetical protein ABT160_42610, partial [Streptomyces sp. NPDC001941]